MLVSHPASIIGVEDHWDLWTYAESRLKQDGAVYPGGTRKCFVGDAEGVVKDTNNGMNKEAEVAYVSSPVSEGRGESVVVIRPTLTSGGSRFNRSP